MWDLVDIVVHAFRFLVKVKWRWAQAYKNKLHKAPWWSFAEAAQASMKAAKETSASLVDEVYYNITDSARLKAKWENHKNSEISIGRGPTPVELLDRSSR